MCLSVCLSVATRMQSKESSFAVYDFSLGHTKDACGLHSCSAVNKNVIYKFILLGVVHKLYNTKNGIFITLSNIT